MGECVSVDIVRLFVCVQGRFIWLVLRAPIGVRSKWSGQAWEAAQMSSHLAARHHQAARNNIVASAGKKIPQQGHRSAADTAH